MNQNNTEYGNPWTCLSSKQIYDNPWIQLIEDQVLRPNGSPGIYGKVHFKNKAIGIVPVDDELNTWLVGQWRYSLHEYSWEIPTGGVPMNEDSQIGAMRELKEETGLVARSWTNMMRIHTSNSVTNEYGYIYLARDLTQENTDWDETELLQIKKVPMNVAIRMVMDSEITDAMSIMGLLKAARILEI